MSDVYSSYLECIRVVLILRTDVVLLLRGDGRGAGGDDQTAIR